MNLLRNGLNNLKRNNMKSEILMTRRNRVYRLFMLMVKEGNHMKARQADYLLRVIDNRLASLQTGNIHKFN